MQASKKPSPDIPDLTNLEDFFAYFLGPVETLSDVELESRLRVLSKKILPLKILMPLLFLAAFAGYFFAVISIGFGNGLIIALLLLAICGVVYVRMFLLKIEIKRLVGHNAVRNVLADVFELAEYSPVGFISQDEIEGTALIDYNWNSCLGSDFIRGNYRGVSFRLSDIRLVQQDSDPDGSQSIRTVFKGQWLIIELNRSLEGTLRLRERKVEGKGMKSDLETENVVFNRKYQILTTDPHTAFYILTPHFMEYIVNMDIQANARTFMSFTGDRVHIAFDNGRDLFETNEKEILRGMNVSQLREQMGREVSYMTALIDELLKNNYLFQ